MRARKLGAVTHCVSTRENLENATTTQCEFRQDFAKHFLLKSRGVLEPRPLRLIVRTRDSSQTMMAWNTSNQGLRWIPATGVCQSLHQNMLRTVLAGGARQERGRSLA